jgi:hypothetical protein
MIPRYVDDISAQWMTDAFSAAFPGVVVTDAVIDEVMDGTATKVFVRLTYGGGGAPAGAPTTVCVKGAFKENGDFSSGSGIYEREGVFYRDIAPMLSPVVERAWFADGDRATGLGVVVMPDLRGKVEFCRITSPLSADEVADGLGVIARYQADTWNAPVLHDHYIFDAPVTRTNGTGQYFATMDHERVGYFLGLPLRTAAIPTELHDPDRIIDLFWRWVDLDRTDVDVLTHGDAHMGNWYRRRDSTLGVMDWQVISRGRPSHDVAYFMTSALEPAVRRSNERDLLRTYLDELAAAGAPAPDFATMLLNYRQDVAYGLMAWLTSLEWMNSEEIHAAAVGRFAHAVLDLDVAGALSV